MKNLLNKIKTYVIAHKKISIIVLIVVLIFSYWIYKKITNTAGETRYITAIVKKGTIVSSVSGSGQVSVSSQIDLKPKVSGDVVYINVKNGQEVKAGTLIVQLDFKDAQKSIRDAQINLESAKLSLAKLKLNSSDENMNADLAKAYDDGFTTVSDAFLDLPDTITGLDTILAQENVSDNTARNSGKTALDYKDQAITLYYQAKNAFEINRINFRKLDRNSSKIDIEAIINETYNTAKITTDAIKSAKNLVDYLAEDTGNASYYTSSKDTLFTYTNTINGHLSSLLSIKTNIKNYKDAFPSTSLDIQSSELTVQQKENTLQDAKDKLEDYYIRAPFSGTVTNINVKRSDAVTSGTVITTFITKQKLAEISLNEVDMAKIKIGQKVSLTFDAVPDLTIDGEISEIDSVGTVDQGVVTYNVKISFDTQDERVKPEMSVSANIITDMKENIIIVPNGAIKSKNGSSYVEQFNFPLPKSTDNLPGSLSKTAPNKIPVKVGISNDTQTEIISGLKEGDEIVIRSILSTGTTAPATSGGMFGASPTGSSNRGGGGAGAGFAGH